VRAYVINLARSTDRRTHMRAELSRVAVDHEIMEAVDGRALDLSDPRIIASIEPSVLARKSLLPNQIANALSHLNVYRKMLVDGQDHAMVLEDDVILPADLGVLADALTEHLTEAEVALLNFESEGGCRLMREASVQLPAGRLLALPADVNQPVSGAAYIITRKACERMAERLLPIRAKVDDWAFRYNEGMLDRIRCVAPLAVIKSPMFESTIERPTAGGLKRHARSLLRFDPGFFDAVIAHRRQRIWRRWTRIEFVDMPFINEPSRLK
jgi:glycosyl transferase, family 25